MNKQIEALAHAYKEVTEKLVGNQHKLDANDNGRIDADDFKRIKAKKKAGKDDPTSNNGDTATMNPKSENKSTQESTKMSIRDKLLSVLERNDEHYKSAAPAEPMDNNLKGAGAKKMAADMKPEVKADGAKAAEDDAKAIEKSAKVAPKNSTDKDAKGDTSIINPVQDITKKGGMKESFSKTVHSIAAAYKSMYEPKVEEEKTDENYAGNYGSSVASYGKEQDHKNRYEKENPGKKWKDLPWGHQDSLSKHYNKNPA